MVDDEGKGVEPENAVSEEKIRSKWRKVLDNLEHIAGRWKNLIALIGTSATIIGIMVAILINLGYFSNPQYLTAELAAKNPKKAKEVAESLRKDPQATDIDKTIVEAISLQRQRKFKEATEKWRRVAKIAEGINNNLAARARASIGYLLAEQKDHAEAIKAYGQAIRLNPNYAAAYNNRGNSMLRLKEYKRAIADYDKAIRLDSNYALAYNNRGVARSDLGQHEAAIVDYKKAFDLKPDYVNAYYNLGNAKLKLGRNEAAIVDYEKAIRLKPDYAEAYYNRGVAKGKLGRKDEAQEDLMTALNLARKAVNKKLIKLADQELKKLDEQ